VKFRTAILPTAAAGLAVGAAIGGVAFASASPASHAPRPRAKSAAAPHSHKRPIPEWVTVRPGETLESIAAAHHVTWREMYATPPNYRVIDNIEHLTVGERLRIPADPKLRAAQFLGVWRHEAAIARAEAARARAARQEAADAQAAQDSQAGQASQASQAGQASQAAPTSTVNQPLTGGMSAFEQCVAWRESSDTPTDPDGLFGILPSTWASLGYSGTAGQASVAQQEAAFNQLYAEYGAQPWAPSDGC
jgi:LysM domain